MVSQEVGQYRTVSFRLPREDYERLTHLALVEAIHQRRPCSFSGLVRKALEHAYPRQPEASRSEESF